MSQRAPTNPVQAHGADKPKGAPRRAEILRDVVAPQRELIETHISWVVLGPTEVWKIKKPVDLGFIDFSTPERREDACRAELELNRRLAPDVYLGMVPVRRDAEGRLTLEGDGDVVDWAVHMRRLADADRADVRLAEGRLDPDMMASVAERLCEFHASSRSDAYTASFGTLDAIAGNVRENFEQTRESIATFLEPHHSVQIQTWQMSFLKANGDRFERRRAAGRVRDGHGDLRLEHVYIDASGVVRIIDCIEFNERFRFGDVASDLAFLAMDLAEHGRVDLAEHCVATYAHHCGDYGLYGVLDFYESYRAYVRAKVSSISALDPDLDVATRERAARCARRHYLLALSSNRRALLSPVVVAVGGWMGSGKSTVARSLGFDLSGPVVEADRTRKELLGIEPVAPVREGSWQGAYDPQFTLRVYDEVFRRASEALESGRPVVLDASFRSQVLRQRAREFASAHGVRFYFVECRADPETCKARLRERERQPSVSDGRVELFDDFVAQWEPVAELDPDQHLVVDTARPLGETMQTLRSFVESWPGGLVQ